MQQHRRLRYSNSYSNLAGGCLPTASCNRGWHSSCTQKAQKPPTAQDIVQAADAWVSEGRFDRIQHGRVTPLGKVLDHNDLLTFWPSSYLPRPQQRDQPPPPPSLPLSEDSKPPTYPEHHILPPTSIKREKSDQPNRRPKDLSKYFDDAKGPLCFNCRKWGHISTACPDRDLYRIRHTQPSQPTVTRDLYRIWCTQPSQPTVTWLPSLLTISIKWEKSDQPDRRLNDLSKYFDDVKGPLCFNCRKWGPSAQLAWIDTSIVSNTPNHLNQQSPDCHLISPWVPLGKANANADALSRQEWPDETTACTTEKEEGDVRST